MRNGHHPEGHVAVVGGGLAGLAAAAYLARAGRPVTVYERSAHPGGRAITNDEGGFLFNLGPHALYLAGAAHRVLTELDVPFEGKKPPLSGYAIRDGALHTLSSAPWWLARTPLLRGRARLDAGRLFAKIARVHPERCSNETIGGWLAREVGSEHARQLALMLTRVSTYTNDTERLSAEVALLQLKLALRNVLYLHGGWQTLVDGLRQKAIEAGAHIETGAGVAGVVRDAAGAATGVELKDGTSVAASAVIVATEPSTAAQLIDDAVLRERAAAALPVRAACLDVGLRTLPEPKRAFALGLDRPYYISVHPRTARLAPEGAATVNVAKYLALDERTDAKELERELEGVLDLLQPGWRDEVEQRRFMPNLTVVSAMAEASTGGIQGRFGPELPGARNVFVAGDWVGPEGWLSDASLASAKRAAELAAATPIATPAVGVAAVTG